MKLKVSAALCTYNGEKYLSSQLESYLAQTYLPDEVVICDDGSQDKTVSILNTFASRAPFPVRIQVNDRNLGSTKNFEKAISLCSGEIIFLSDQDDVWEPTKVERICKEFESDDNIGLVFSDAALVDENLQPLERNLLDGRLTCKEKWLIDRGELFLIMFERNIVTGATLAFRARYRDAIYPVSPDIPNMFHDEWIAVILSIISKGVFIDTPLIKYRQHDEQQIGMSFASDVRMDFKLPWKKAIDYFERELTSNLDSLVWRKGYFISKLNIPDRILNALDTKIQNKQECVKHYRMRKTLPNNHLRRLRPVITELLKGRYQRFSGGLRSATRDFFVDHDQEVEYREVICRG